MNTNFEHVFRLPRIQDSLTAREAKINMLVNNLRIADVQEDSTFQLNKKRIKDQILLKPVHFDEPKIVDSQYSERHVSWEDQLNGVSRQVYTFQVSVPFSGNSDLISHACASPVYGSSDKGIVIPNWNSIILYVQLSADEPEQAKEEARKDLAPTIQNAESNNATVENWNRTVEIKIDQALDFRRADLIQKYG